MERLIIATGNAGQVREFKEIFQGQTEYFYERRRDRAEAGGERYNV